MGNLYDKADALFLELTDNMFDAASFVDELEELKDSYVHIYLASGDIEERENVMNHFDLLSQLVGSMKRSLRKSYEQGQCR